MTHVKQDNLTTGIIHSWLRLRNRHFLLFDILILLFTPIVALFLRLDTSSNPLQFAPTLALYTLAALAIRLLIFRLFGLYSRYWRYASIDELTQIVAAGFWSTALVTILFFSAQALAIIRLPRSLPFIDSLLVVLFVGGIRFSVRLVDRRRYRRPNSKLKPVAIMGAGNAGAMIARELWRNPHLGMVAVAFFDDDPTKQGVRIQGIPVLGPGETIPTFAREHKIRQVIIAMPTAPGKTIRKIVNICEQAQVQTRTIPGVYELLDGTVRVEQLRNVEIEDLLRREPVRTDVTAVHTLLHDRRVLVTGGGGSIGSELCRQVLSCDPAELFILGHGENSVFETYHELRRLFPNATITPLIADIRDSERLQVLFTRHHPEIVFHAAAHKHVPLMEQNPAEAVTNNLFGTSNLLDVSIQTNVERYVMISTDKAVNPSSVMGASKRAAEMLVHQAACRSGRPYVAVRFGNVLGSRGSVVHTFRSQIAAGGPITVTHPEMKRYFMTIPEAVQLVLQAAVLGHGDEVFVLDMGDPIKICDLAHDMIRLSGLQLGRDIDIVFTESRPGEKLFEEMFFDGEEYNRTGHEKVFLAHNAASLIPQDFDDTLAQLREAAHNNSPEHIINLLQRLVPEYRPLSSTATNELSETDTIASEQQVTRVRLQPVYNN